MRMTVTRHRAVAIGAAICGIAAAALLAANALLPFARGEDGHLARVALLDPTVRRPATATIAGEQGSLVVIDAGHGGFDPGAVSPSGLAEKDVVLNLAKAVRNRLLEQGGVRVAMTRDDDRFLPLHERRDIARQVGADLFISIHADSGGEEQDAAGASLYTLSQQASGREAERFAARENSADVVNGVPLGGGGGTVDTILFQLSQRRAQEEAADFARLLVREAAGRLVFRDPPRRSAALVVLTAPDVPSVLFEAGFMTNPDEAVRLSSPEGQEQFAGVTAAAVRSFFANRNR